MRGAVTRGVALFLGLFTIANVVGDLRFARANSNVWWLDFWPLPLVLQRVILLVLAAALIIHALSPVIARRTRLAGRAMLFLAAAAAVLSAIQYYGALGRKEIRTSFPLPLSLIVAVALIAIAVHYGEEPRGHPSAIAAAAIAATVFFPLLQVCFFGVTDYRRPAQAIVVFGARAYANGTASDALADRVRTACDLYRAGLAPRIIMSGGPGEGRASEPEVMRALAQQLGVPASAIIEDRAGLNTEATVRNTRALMNGPVLMVSHFYHLPRIKITCERYGIEAYTVPSQNTVPLSMAFNIARESAAFWWYYTNLTRSPTRIVPVRSTDA